MSLSNCLLVIIGGPTASGKTALSIRLAKHFQTEILSADSRQLYSEMNIGVARPTQHELETVSHHFIADRSVHNPCNAYNYSSEAIEKIDTLFQKYQVVFMCGGSGLFLKSVYHGIDEFPDPSPQLRQQLNSMKVNDYPRMLNTLQKLDPNYFETADIKNPARVQRALEVCLTSGKPYSSLCSGKAIPRNFQILQFALMPEMKTLESNIQQRTVQMRKNGLTQEVRQLFPLQHLKPLQSIGYNEVFSFFQGQITEDEAYIQIAANTRKYAKKQMTWLKKENGFHTVRHDQDDLIFSTINSTLRLNM